VDVTPEDHLLAAELATRAGLRLLALREEGHPTDELRTLGDAESNRYLVSALEATCPNDAILSEESLDDLKRLSRHRVWIVDPLDGTREFGEAGRTDFAVHVALAVGGVATVGAVALPGRDLLLSTARAQPEVPRRDPAQSLRIVVSRSRPPAFARAVADELDGELLELGSAGAKAMAVVLGEADAYLHAGGMHEWDTCAPVAVATACGLHASRVDGRPLRYNQRKPWQPDLLICRPELAQRILEAVGDVADPGDLADPPDADDPDPRAPSAPFGAGADGGWPPPSVGD
jgi:3'(2'), 5'-bisphosphate nucleotidase